MLDEIYKDYLIDEKDQDKDFNITLGIKGGNLPKTNKIKKTMSDEEQEKLRDQNELIRHERKALVDPIAEKIAKFKMNWLSAPIRRAMNAAM